MLMENKEESLQYFFTYMTDKIFDINKIVNDIQFSAYKLDSLLNFFGIL